MYQVGFFDVNKKPKVGKGCLDAAKRTFYPPCVLAERPRRAVEETIVHKEEQANVRGGEREGCGNLEASCQIYSREDGRDAIPLRRADAEIVLS